MIRFRSALKLGLISERNERGLTELNDPNAALDAFHAMFDLLPQVIWMGSPVSSRYKAVTSLEVRFGVSSAIAIAINTDQHETALEWIEQGRSIVWRQLLLLRSPLDELKQVDCSLAEKLQDASRKLDALHSERPVGRRFVEEKSFAQENEQGFVVDASAEAQGGDRRRLAKEWEDAILQCRALPGFEHFLRPEPFSTLSTASQAGIVVTIHSAGENHAALILCEGSTDTICVQLSNFTSTKAKSLHAQLNSSLKHANMRVRATSIAGPRMGDIRQILSELWYDVVVPIFDALAIRYPVVSATLYPDAHISDQIYRRVSLRRIFLVSIGALQAIFLSFLSMLQVIMPSKVSSIEHSTMQFRRIFRPSQS
jgi:hypothetical protein